jgi:hypothetical protein
MRARTRLLHAPVRDTASFWLWCLFSNLVALTHQQAVCDECREIEELTREIPLLFVGGEIH